MVFEHCPVGVKRVESKRGKVVYRARTRKGGQNFSASFQSLEKAMAFLEKPGGIFTPTQVEKTQQSLTYAIDRYLREILPSKKPNTILVDIAAILGHRDLKQTMRYAHLSQHHTRGLLERMTSTL